MFNRKGEISTIVILGTLVLMGVAALMSSTLNNQTQTVSTQAAGNCPVTSISLEGSTCKIQINYTPGDPEPAAPRTLVCALINPARSATIANDQLLANQGVVTYDVFNKTNVGSIKLNKEADFSTKLNPVPADGNYKLVVYDFTNPTSCLKEIAIPAVGIEEKLNQNSTNTGQQPTQSSAPSESQNPTNVPITTQPTASSELVNTPNPTQTISDRTRGNVTPTITVCRAGQIRCLSGECVDFQDQCPTGPTSPSIRPNLNPNSRITTVPITVTIAPNPTITPVKSNKVKIYQTVESRVCTGNFNTDNGCVDLYGVYKYQL